VADEINLDTGTAMAFIGEGSTVRHQLKALLLGKDPVMTQTALVEFRHALSLWAGPIELARAVRFLSRIRIVSDSPSARAQGLRTTSSFWGQAITWVS
jgi:hypothetical protein